MNHRIRIGIGLLLSLVAMGYLHGTPGLLGLEVPLAGPASATTADVVINELVAENIHGLKDETGQPEDWIELYNRGNIAVNLAGWSLTDDPHQPDKWTFPAVTLSAHQYLVVFASGKDLKPTKAGAKLHTNFKLNLMGEYVGLYHADPSLHEVSALNPQFPELRPDYSYGRDIAGQWRYFSIPTPGMSNGNSSMSEMVAPVHFSVQRGFFDLPFNLSLATKTPDACIRFTLDGSMPTETNGIIYTNFINISMTRVVRAAAFKTNCLPSRIITQTYLYGLPKTRSLLPVLSLVTATNNLFGPTGIMETKPRNTTKHGLAWERSVSAELIRPVDNGGFQADCGLRVQGGSYIRGLYDPRGPIPNSKYSFRLYFRGDYGPGQLEYALLPNIPIDTFDQVSLRAGMNDPTNPFIRDELVRRLFGDTGQVTSHGTFVNLFINGSYKGYYNPTERIGPEFLQAWHGGGPNWDLLAQSGEVRSGDNIAWNALRSAVNKDLTITTNYLDVEQRLDLINFIDYLLVNIYSANSDWPWNNWRAARERVPSSKFRFYVWDAEWAFGYNHPVTWNTLANELARTDNDIGQFYKKLRTNPEFRLLFADRIHHHFFNDGALTDARIRLRYEELKNTMTGTISGFNNSIGTAWIPGRRGNILKHFATAGLMQSSNAPVFNQFGGWVPHGFKLTMSVPNGLIYYTTNGADPRALFSNKVTADALLYSASRAIILNQSVIIRARCLEVTNWSAVTEATFAVKQPQTPLVISEIMYVPGNMSSEEFIELWNPGTTPVDLRGMRFRGITFRFPENTLFLAPNQRLVLIPNLNIAAFNQCYPGVAIAGTYQGSLAFGNQSLALLDRNGNTLINIRYQDNRGWPKSSDGVNHSFEFINPQANPDDPSSWCLNISPGGTPGAAPASALASAIRLNELMIDNQSAVAHIGNYGDWIELYNTSSKSVDISNWRLIAHQNAPAYQIPQFTSVPAKSFLMVWCDQYYNTPGVHIGFSLDNYNGCIQLFDAQWNRIDAISYGQLLSNFSIGRIGNDTAWRLTIPTPGTANRNAESASVTNLVINELLAKAPAGGTDWIEIYNRDSGHPVALHGLYIGNSNGLFQIKTPSFLAPRNFVRLWADEQSGPDHVGFKLSAAGGSLFLLDDTGNEFERVTYGSQTENVSFGRMPDGGTTFTFFSGSPSPGAPNYVLGANVPILNEFLAYNRSTGTSVSGRAAGWIELYNPLASALNLTGMSLSVNRRLPNQWPIPVDTIMTPHSYLLIWCDGASPGSTQLTTTLNTGQDLERESGGIYLFNKAGQVLDYVDYGFQLPNQTVGRTSAGWKLMSNPTPGTMNSGPAQLGSISCLRFNEWMADPPNRQEDWFEWYNSDTLPVDLSGLLITDDASLTGKTQYCVEPLSFIAAHGYVRWIADGHPEKGFNHVNFQLDTQGETLRIYDANLNVVDNLDYQVQRSGISEGRWPNGSDSLVSFVQSSSPGEENVISSATNPILHFTVMQKDPAGNLRLRLTVPLNSAYYTLQSSTNLIDWISLDTKTAAEGIIQFEISALRDSPCHFYRALQLH